MTDDSRRWYGELDDRPALLGGGDTATTSVEVPNEVILEYSGEDELDEDPFLAPTAAGSIASVTLRHNGYTLLRVLGIRGGRESVTIDVEVTGAIGEEVER